MIDVSKSHFTGSGETGKYAPSYPLSDRRSIVFTINDIPSITSRGGPVMADEPENSGLNDRGDPSRELE